MVLRRKKKSKDVGQAVVEAYFGKQRR